MNDPRQLLTRARMHKNRTVLVRPDIRPAPAPTPTSVPPMANLSANPAPSAPSPVPAGPSTTNSGPVPTPPAPAPAAPPAGMTTARPAGSHALYSQIMRSHDRMGTRHL